MLGNTEHSVLQGMQCMHQLIFSKESRGYLLVVIEIGNMGAISKVSQIPYPQDALLVPTGQNVACHSVPGDHIHICVGGIHAEHAAPPLSRVPDPQAVVHRT